MRRIFLQALLHSAAFAGAALWAFDVGYRVAGAWLGMLMGLQAGIFAVLLLSGAPAALHRVKRRLRSLPGAPPAPVADHLRG